MSDHKDEGIAYFSRLVLGSACLAILFTALSVGLTAFVFNRALVPFGLVDASGIWHHLVIGFSAAIVPCFLFVRRWRGS